MIQFEYLTKVFQYENKEAPDGKIETTYADDLLDAALSEVGGQGWELVQVLAGDPPRFRLRAIFKRPRPMVLVHDLGQLYEEKVALLKKQFVASMQKDDPPQTAVSSATKMEAFGAAWKRVFDEDTEVKDRERVADAWKRMYGTEMPARDAADEHEDLGDMDLSRHGDRLIRTSYDGVSIWELVK